MATTAAAVGSLANLNNAFENDKKKASANVGVMEKKRGSLDVRHRYLIEKFAAFVDEKPIVIENSLLLGQKLELVNDFLAEGGSRKVLFFWQKVTTFDIVGRRKCSKSCESATKTKYFNRDTRAKGNFNRGWRFFYKNQSEGRYQLKLL